MPWQTERERERGGRDKGSNRHPESWHLQENSRGHQAELRGIPSPTPPTAGQAQCGLQEPTGRARLRDCQGPASSNANASRWQSWDALDKTMSPKDAKTLIKLVLLYIKSHLLTSHHLLGKAQNVPFPCARHCARHQGLGKEPGGQLSLLLGSSQPDGRQRNPSVSLSSIRLISIL